MKNMTEYELSGINRQNFASMLLGLANNHGEQLRDWSYNELMLDMIDKMKGNLIITYLSRHGVESAIIWIDRYLKDEQETVAKNIDNTGFHDQVKIIAKDMLNHLVKLKIR